MTNPTNNKTGNDVDDHMVPTTIPGDEPGSRRGLDWRHRWRNNRRWLWASMLIATVTLVALGGGMIRISKIAFLPGQINATEAHVTISGIDTFPPEGELSYITVSSRQLNLWTWLQARNDPDADVNDEVNVRGGQTPEESRVCSQAMMRFSQSNATIVALSLLGYEVITPTGSGVERVIEDSAADGIITCDDVIVGIDGTDVISAAAAVEIIQARQPGDVISVELEDLSGEVRVEEIALGDDGTGNPLLGVRPQTRFGQNELDFSIDIDTGRTGGPSAGLAFTLSILDSLTEGELAGLQNVAITGSIRLDGSVGNVGGVRQKVIAARRGGAVAFIMPRQLRCSDLVEPFPDCPFDVEWEAIVDSAAGLPIHEVTTVFEALAVLEELGGDPLPEAQPAPESGS